MEGVKKEKDVKSVGICDAVLKRLASRADWKKSREKEKLRGKIGAPDASSLFARTMTRIFRSKQRKGGVFK